VPRIQKLLLSPGAAEDLKAVTEPLRSEIAERLRLLKRFPHLGARLSGRYRGLRVTTVGIFRIFYRVQPRGVEVIYIRHCKRQTPAPPQV